MISEPVDISTILIVEDDPLLNKTMGTLLQREGFETEGFITGVEVLKRIFSSTDTILLLLDYSLPDMTAKEIVEKIRERGLSIPFVIITGHGDEQLAVEMMKVGALDYIIKSLQFHELLPNKIRHVCEEISNRRRLAHAEASVIKSVQEWQRTFNSIADVVLILDNENKITRCNRAALALFGKTEEEILGNYCCMVVHGFPTPVPSCPVVRMTQSTVRETSEMTLGNRFYSITADPIIDSTMTILGAVHVISDITERKQTEEENAILQEQLRQSQKMEAIGQLAGGVAHDFNNLLGGIMGNAELIKMQTVAQSQVDRYVNRIIDASNKAADLTHQLLAFARKARVNFVPVDMHASIGNTIELLTHTVDKRIDIQKDFSASLSKVNGDSNQLENALLNIGINARDAMPRGGVLSFATANITIDGSNKPHDALDLAPGSYLRISIRDTGTGMNEETMSRIFEPFFTTKDPGKGTGLGLAAVYGCMRQHNGHISVDSIQGKGSVFTLFLPVTSAIVGKKHVETNAQVTGKGSILVIDDEELIGASACELLAKIGYTPSFMTNPSQALEFYRTNFSSIAAVILDLIMPAMNGLDVFRELKRINPEVKAVVASGFSDEKIERQVMEEGAVAFVGKPYTISDIASALAGAIGD
jgi:two-component system, cell cycle sensor histidine kinase and response regulator CckA